VERLYVFQSIVELKYLDFLNQQVEYDTPQVLLHKKGGLFRALVDGSGDRKALYAAAQQKAGQSNSG
jgi:hypothetical protein